MHKCTLLFIALLFLQNAIAQTRRYNNGINRQNKNFQLNKINKEKIIENQDSKNENEQFLSNCINDCDSLQVFENVKDSCKKSCNKKFNSNVNLKRGTPAEQRHYYDNINTDTHSEYFE